MNEPAQSRTAREVIAARRLYWVTIVAGSMMGGPPPPLGSAAGIAVNLIATMWIILIVGINVAAMRRSGLHRSGVVAPVLTALFCAGALFNVWRLAADLAYAFEVRNR